MEKKLIYLSIISRFEELGIEVEKKHYKSNAMEKFSENFLKDLKNRLLC